MNKSYLLFLMLFSLLSGCASVHQTFISEKNTTNISLGYENKVYAGTRKDGQVIVLCFTSGPWAIIFCPVALFATVDLPFSFVGDTLFLPYTIPKSASNKRLKEQRAQDTEKKMVLVRDFVRNNKDVIREAGEIKYLSAGPSLSNRMQVVPDRYEVTVEGNSGIKIYAIVRDSSSSDNVNFSLLCISHLMWGNRDLQKDVCER